METVDDLEERVQELQNGLNMSYDQAYELALFEAGLMTNDVFIVGNDGIERPAPVSEPLR